MSEIHMWCPAFSRVVTSLINKSYRTEYNWASSLCTEFTSTLLHISCTLNQKKQWRHLTKNAFIGLFVIWNYRYLSSYGLSLHTFLCALCVSGVVHLQRVWLTVVFCLCIIRPCTTSCKFLHYTSDRSPQTGYIHNYVHITK